MKNIKLLTLASLMAYLAISQTNAAPPNLDCPGKCPQQNTPISFSPQILSSVPNGNGGTREWGTRDDCPEGYYRVCQQDYIEHDVEEGLQYLASCQPQNCPECKKSQTFNVIGRTYTIQINVGPQRSGGCIDDGDLYA